MRAIRSAVILPMIAGSTMAASPFVDPKGFSCSDRTPPATSSPVSATRPAFSRPSPPILLFGSPLRKLQPSQLAIEAPKTAARAAASSPGVRTVAESPLGGQDAVAVLSNRSDPRAPTARPIDTLLYRFTDSSSPVPAPWECPRCTFEHTGVEAEFQACGMCGTAKPPPKEPPPEAPSPTPLAPSPVALIMEDSPSTLPPSPHSHGSYESPPSVSPKLLHANLDTDSPPGHLLGGPAAMQLEATNSFQKIMESEDLYAQEPNGHPLRLVFPQLARHYMRAEWQRHPEPQITGRTERQVWRRLQLAQLCTRHPWWR